MKSLALFFDSIINSGVFQSFKMAMKSILSNKLRSFLTMLGIIIGVVALVVLVSIVNGGTSSITGTISELGTDLVSINFYDQNDSLTIEDCEEISKEDGIGDVAPVVSMTTMFKYNSSLNSAFIYGVTQDYFNIRGMNILVGRFLKKTDITNYSNVCVITESTAQNAIGYLDCVGATINVNNSEYVIVGVIDDSENSIEQLIMFGSSQIYVPITTYSKNNSTTLTISEVYVSAPTGYTVKQTTNILNNIMPEYVSNPDNMWINDQSQIEEALGTVTTVLSVVLGAIAGISLFVGGIGIMNIMLVTVTERTREIGIRKAIGASRGVILRQFLFEAVVVCLFGCAIGIFVSWLLLKIGSVITINLGVVFEMNSTVVIIAVIFCFLIGLVFGLYPANKAAKMKPIDALHYGG